MLSQMRYLFGSERSAIGRPETVDVCPAERQLSVRADTLHYRGNIVEITLALVAN